MSGDQDDGLRQEQVFAPQQWTGTVDVKGKTIFLHSEQGFGDNIQFSRYVPLVKNRGAFVVLGLPPELKRLLSHTPGADVVTVLGQPLRRFDLHCPLMSLPLAFKTDLSTIPPVRHAIAAPRDLAMAWDARLGPKGSPRIGVAWSGQFTHQHDRERSISLSTLRPLFDFPGQFVSLNKDVRATDKPALRNGNILHFGNELTDFADTAAIIEHLDLIVTVDTAVAHLAGAMGKQVWILLPYIPDWRWLLDRDDSPWYPTARLFRQDEACAWESVIARVHEALFKFFGSQRS